MARLAILIGALLLAAMPVTASNAVSLGYSDETTITGPGTDACASGTLIYNHDESFENGYAWQYGGSVPPYYGAFGEGYDLGYGVVRCGSFWVSGLQPPPVGALADCYIWLGGIETDPGEVLAVVTGVEFMNVPCWPGVGRNDIEIGVGVPGAFTVGYWGDWQSAYGTFFCAADENGPGGHPWTCIAPGQGYPSGWQDPAIVWPDAKALGCGVYFESHPTAAESPTWGAIKAMFRQ
jgi:hypothetical protein